MKLRDGEPSAPPIHRHTFRLTTQPAFDPVAAVRAGWELAGPLAAVNAPPGGRGLPATGSFLSLDQSNVMIVELKPATFGEPGEGEPSHVILRLQEIAGRATTVEVSSAFPIQRARGWPHQPSSPSSRCRRTRCACRSARGRWSHCGWMCKGH